MIIHKKSKDLTQYILSKKAQGLKIGFVPTMGALHEGHLSLIRESKKTNNLTVVSIFVNPLQFNNKGDLQAYPRDEEEDKKLLLSCDTDLLFLPDEPELYPEQPQISVQFGILGDLLEGKFRPGHFNGVGVVLCKLFNIVQPDRAYFGQKDLQQYLLVKRMIFDLSFPIEIIGVETVRYSSGLALSSRNRRLSKNGIEIAANIFNGLKQAEQLILNGEQISRTLSEVIQFYNSIDGLKIEYFTMIDPNTFLEIQTLTDKKEIAICVAAFVEEVRLIDNLYLQLEIPQL
jgi:pantoate--beta-alanine ligase